MPPLTARLQQAGPVHQHRRLRGISACCRLQLRRVRDAQDALELLKLLSSSSTPRRVLLDLQLNSTQQFIRAQVHCSRILVLVTTSPVCRCSLSHWQPNTCLLRNRRKNCARRGCISTTSSPTSYVSIRTVLM